MKTFKRLWEQFTSQENLEAAIVAAARGHRHWHSAARALADVAATAAAFRAKLTRGDYRFTPPKEKTIRERGKERRIVCPCLRDHVVHHALVQALMPALSQGLHPHTCGSIPGRGTAYAKKLVERAMARRKPKFYLQMDVRQFFASIAPDAMLAALRARVQDRKMLAFAEGLLRSTKGLPLGYYTSQWFANFLLTPLDHLITGAKGVRGHVRYMDDIVVFGSNKRQLRRVKDAVAAWLRSHGLALKPNWKIALFCRPRGMALDFLGYQFRPERTTLRERLFLRARRRLARIRERLGALATSAREASSAMSYLGWLQSSATRRWQERARLAELLPLLKRIIRNEMA